MSLVPRLPPFVSRLGLKIGGTAGAVAGLGVGLVSSVSVGVAVLFGLGTAALTYAASHVWLHRRLRHLQSVLHEIRTHQFDAQTPPSGPHDDELSTLLWEVYRTGQSLETEIRKLKEMESYRREFIGNVSHELKTPIFSVQGFAETLLDGALTDDSVNRTFLKKILHHANRLDNLARDLSTITKIETEELDMSSEAFDVTELFDTAVESVEFRAEETGIMPRQKVAPDLPQVYGDFDRLRRVLVNLVDNAIKYNAEGGTVQLEAEPENDEVVIRVMDDGIGISPDHFPRLTERFYRVDKSRSRNQGGTGLGLAIVKHILGAHDRELHVESAPGEGSTFSFTLPTSPQSSLKPA
ncbi:sensor histidine kinase [Salinibacter altiplanensis]|uniref:sensor histidine kinase n=1 Tax=Salinibacter altiplanensis TaxID=1803181 RepID=UPI000C9F3CD1|nr:ATP-binding protein [Salinibacter altiplanensis]